MDTVSATELRKSKRNEKRTDHAMGLRMRCKNVVRWKINILTEV